MGDQALLSDADGLLLAAHIRDVPDWPTPGVMFKDLTPLFGDPHAFDVLVLALARAGRDDAGAVVVDRVVGVEARGFILGAPVARELGVGFVPVRKHGKLPFETLSAAYALEYGEAVVEVHQDAFAAGDRVLVVDDVLATGGTLAATLDLVRRCGARPVAAVVLLELAALGGRAAVHGVDLAALLTV